MNGSNVVLIGNVVTPVQTYTTSNGHSMARFRMVVQERRFDRGLDRFVDGDASYFTVIAWRHIATNVIESVNQGDPIVVSGRLRVRDWKAEDGRSGTVSEVTVQAIGHDLSRGCSTFRRVSRQTSQRTKVVTTDAA